MSLELKHIAPYLPYGLKIKTDRLGVFQIDGYRTLNHGIAILTNDTHIGYLHEVKPMLRQLSDLTAEMLDMDAIHFHIFIEKVKNQEAKYCNMVKLFEGHYDVFSLLERGLAVALTLPIQS